MLKAIGADARVISDVEDELRHDYDLALLAFSQDRRALHFYSSEEDFEFMVSFASTVRRKIAEYDTFTKVVVYNIVDRQKKRNASCTLSLLNQGPETARCHLDMISSYLGLPSEAELAMLCKASANLLYWGF